MIETVHLAPLDRLDAGRFENPTLLKRLAAASRQLAELKGVAGVIPEQGLLINTLGLQEAKDSSAIENIVTTHDELFNPVPPRHAYLVLPMNAVLWAGKLAIFGTLWRVLARRENSVEAEAGGRVG